MHRHFRIAWSSEGRSHLLTRVLFRQGRAKWCVLLQGASHRQAFSVCRPCFSSLATNFSDHRHQPCMTSPSMTRSAAALDSIATKHAPPMIHQGSKVVSEEPLTMAKGGQDDSPKKKVLLLMSGGVDSSMCALLLKEQGYDVTGLYMHNWNHEEETRDTLEEAGRDSRVTPPPPLLSSHRNTTFLTEHVPQTTDGGGGGGRGGRMTQASSGSVQQQQQQHPKVCTSERDWADVQAVCKALEIPCRRLDFSREYWHQVFEVMLAAYERGFTPNPDIDCNREIKFGQLVEWCRANGGLGPDRPGLKPRNPQSQPWERQLPTPQGWDYLATGHYAHVVVDNVTGRAKLMRARDSNKDQTYYLSTLSEQVLRHVLFPLAGLDKPTIKAMARASGYATLQRIVADKKESMGICFVGQRRRFGDFLKEYLQPKPGDVRVGHLDGQIIGQHRGLFQYTVGQASGVTYGHYKWVVLRSDIPTNTLIVVEGTQNPLLYSPGLLAGSWHWISGQAPPLLPLASVAPSSPNAIAASDLEYPFVAQIRHRQTPQPCRLEVLPSRDHDASISSSISDHIPQFRVLFKDAQRAIAPGQQIVLYQHDECLGGGVILSSLPPQIVQ